MTVSIVQQLSPPSLQEGGAAGETDLLYLEPGRVAGLIGPPGFGLTRIGLWMLTERASLGSIAYVDVRGWLCPPAAWELGIPPERLVVVRCADPARWGRVIATLLEGVRGLYAEVPAGIKEAQLRKLGALARSRRTPLVLRPVRGDLPGGAVHLRLEAREVRWEGAVAGHGRLRYRRVVLEATGKATRGMRRMIEVEDDGADAVRLVPRLAVAPVGSTAG